jgi:hypothetical protein
MFCDFEVLAIERSFFALTVLSSTINAGIADVGHQWIQLGKLGVDVMITIFCDFRKFSAKKLAFFSKTNVMITILHDLPLF